MIENIGEVCLPYLLFMNPLIGLNYDYETQHCKAFHSSSVIRPCNRVYNKEVPTDAEIENIKAFFGDTAFSWAVNETDTRSSAILEKHNLSYKVTAPLMIKILGDITKEEQNPDITVARLNSYNHDTLAEWVHIMSRAFGADNRECSKIVNTFIQRTMPGTMTLYLGYYQGFPTAIGMMLHHNTVAALHWIGTLPEYRRKGLARAITHEMFIDSQQSGCTKAILLSSDMGKALYESLEFTRYATYRMYGNY